MSYLSFQVSYTFCKDFIAGLVKDMSATDFGRTSILIKAFQRVSIQTHFMGLDHVHIFVIIKILRFYNFLFASPDDETFPKWVNS